MDVCSTSRSPHWGGGVLWGRRNRPRLLAVRLIRFAHEQCSRYLAEFLVARAVGAQGQRVEWDAFDVLAPDGTRIEVKSSAYVQAWAQRRPSRIVFSGLTARTWTPQDGASPTATFNADVYVFAVQTAKTQDEYDPFDVGQWSFYALGRRVVQQLGYRSLSLSTLRRVTTAVSYVHLANAIESAAAG